MNKIVAVKRITGYVYQLIRENDENFDFLLPSGDGYDIIALTREIEAIEKYTGKPAQIYCGMDYDSIPFSLIYEIWNKDDKDAFESGASKRLWGPWIPPTRDQYNTYEYGFIHVISL